MSIIDTIVFLIFTGGVVLLGCSFFRNKFNLSKIVYIMI